MSPGRPWERAYLATRVVLGASTQEALSDLSLDARERAGALFGEGDARAQRARAIAGEVRGVVQALSLMELAWRS